MSRQGKNKNTKCMMCERLAKVQITEHPNQGNRTDFCLGHAITHLIGSLMLLQVGQGEMVPRDLIARAGKYAIQLGEQVKQNALMAAEDMRKDHTGRN